MTVSRKYIGQHPAPTPSRIHPPSKAPTIDAEVTYRLVSGDKYHGRFTIFGEEDPTPGWTMRQGRVVYVESPDAILVLPTRGTRLQEATLDCLRRPHGSAPWKARQEALGTFYWSTAYSAHWRRWVPTCQLAQAGEERGHRWTSLVRHGAVPAWFLAPNLLTNRRDYLWEQGRRLYAIGVRYWAIVPDNTSEWIVLNLLDEVKNHHVKSDRAGHLARAIVRDKHRMVDLRHERPLWEAQVAWCAFFEPSTRAIFEAAGVIIPGAE